MRHLRVTMILLTAVVFVLGISTVAMAQANYPNRPLRMIVPFAPGGSNDILARAVGQRLSEVIGQPVVVDNRAGAGGEVGASLAAKSTPDGYNMLLGSLGNLAHNAALKAKLSYDPVRDFAPVAMLATSSFIVVVNPSLPVKNIKELIAYAKANPGKLNYATPGLGSSFHMATELFMHMTGIKMVHVPYKGSAPALIELIANQTQVCFSTMPAALQHVKSGKLRAIAVTSAKRAAVTPDVPTVKESGLPDYVVENWQGIVVPKQTPAALVQKLNLVLLTTLKRPGMADVLAMQGLEEAPSTPEAFGELIRSEVEKYTKVAKAANIKME